MTNEKTDQEIADWLTVNGWQGATPENVRNISGVARSLVCALIRDEEMRATFALMSVPEWRELFDKCATVHAGTDQP